MAAAFAGSGAAAHASDNTPRAGLAAGRQSAQEPARKAPDNSSVIVEERDGTRVETRTFDDPKSRVARVVRTTTPDGKRVTLVYYRDGSVRRLQEGGDESVLEETGEAIAAIADSAADVTKDVVSGTAKATGTVVEKAGDVAGAVRDRTVEGAKATADAGGKVAEGTAEVVSDTASATKRVAGRAVEAGGRVVEGAGEVAKEGVEKTGAAVERTKEVAGDVAGGTADVVEKTAEGAASATKKTGKVAKSTGGAFGRGVRAIGRGIKRVFN
jgi:hypothetical protein